LALLRRAGLVVAYVNGRLAGWIPATEDERGLVLPALAASEGKRRVLILAGSLGAYLPTLLEEGAGEVTLVAQDRRALEALGAQALELGEALKDSRARVIEADPRAYLRSLPVGRFDLLFLPTAYPTTAAANRLFTQEAFRQMRRVLGESGLLVLPLPTHPAGQISPGAFAAKACLRSLESIYPGQIQSFGSSPVICLAGSQLGSLEPGKLAKNLPGSSLGPDLIYYLEQILDPGEVEAGKRSLEGVEARENRDLHPWAFGAAQWASLQEGTSVQERNLTLGGFLLAVLLGAVLVVRRVGAGPGLGALSSGGVAIVSWGASLYLFQLARGALYREIGMVGAVSLLGLALGALGEKKISAPLALWAAAASFLLAGRLPPGPLAALVALAAGGLGSFAAGLVMATLLRSYPENPGALQAGDLIGASAGSLLVSGVILTGPGPDMAVGLLVLVGLGWKLLRGG
jgi:hypothetical protein